MRLATLALALAGALSLPAHATQDFPDDFLFEEEFSFLTLEDSSGQWLVDVELTSATAFGFEHLPTFTDALAGQSFWFSIDGGAPAGLDTLDLLGWDQPSVDQGTVYYGGTRAPLAVDISYSLMANGARSATLLEVVDITNTGDAAIDLSWFVLTDWDLSDGWIDRGYTVYDPLSIGQHGWNGNEGVVTILDTGGADATAWEVSSFPDLLDEIDSGLPGFNLVNGDTSNGQGVASDDYMNGFQLDYLDLQPGKTVSLTVEKSLELGSLTSPFNPILPDAGSGLPGDPFGFTFPVDDSDIIYWVDPVVAVGYEYVNRGGLNFATFTVPGPAVGLPSLGDDLFGLYLYDPLLGDYAASPALILNGADPTANTVDFTALVGAGGVDRFLVADIEPEAGLDPTDPTAFVAGLSFVGTGIANFDMIARTTNYPVSAPPLPMLLGLALAGLVLAGRRRYG